MERAASRKQRQGLHPPTKVRATHAAKFDNRCEQDQSEENVTPHGHRAVDGYDKEVAHR